MNVPNVRIESGLELRVRLKDNGVSLDWSSLQGVKALLYSVEQKAVAGAAEVAIDKEDSKILIVKYPGSSPQYTGLAKLIVRCEYNGKQKTYDIAVANFVETTDEATGVIVLDDPTISVGISVEDISTSLLDEAINAALAAAEKAMSAAQQAKDEADKLPGIATNLQNAIDAAAATNSEIKSNESERLKSEQKRENSESARVEAEQARASAEEVRKTAENSRINKENSRINAESQRESNESEREARENQRIAEFSNMQSTISDRLSLVDQSLEEITQSENDRVTNEAERIAAEEQRTLNEAERQIAEEIRLSSETERKENEEQRISTFGTFEGKLTELKDTDDRMKLLLGYNAARSVINIELGVSGKYVQCASRSAVANSAFAISKPFEVEACSELLIKTGFNPSDASHSGLDLTVIAIYEEIERQRKVQKKDGSNNPLYYVVTIDENGNETVTSEETTEDTGYPVYVMETYTETRYLPNNEDRFVAIPDSGYYVANIPQSCKVVISYKPGATDTAVIVEKHGALANLISQVFGIYEHRTMVEAMVSLAARVDALESRRGLLGNATAGTLDVSEITKCLYPTVLRGHGVPAASNIPDNLPEGLPWDGVPVFVSQLYINLDATSGGLYYAIGHDSVSDWKQA